MHIPQAPRAGFRRVARGWRPRRWAGRSAAAVKSGRPVGPSRMCISPEAARPPAFVVGPGYRLWALAARVEGAT